MKLLTMTQKRATKALHFENIGGNLSPPKHFTKKLEGNMKKCNKNKNYRQCWSCHCLVHKKRFRYSRQVCNSCRGKELHILKIYSTYLHNKKERMKCNMQLG